MTSSREHSCRDVDLDRLQLQIKHADKLLVCGGAVFVIEETSNPKNDDVRKIVETIEWLIAGGINYVMADREPSRYIDIVHAERRVDDPVYRALVFEARRIARPIHVVKCNETLWRKVNADVNAAINIARRIGYKVEITRKIESYLVTHNGVKPLNPHRRANTRDPEVRNPAL